MSRDIKFRVWASNDTNPGGRMYMPGDEIEPAIGNHKEPHAFMLSLFGDIYSAPTSLESAHRLVRARWANSALHAMQFTGLHDRSGKEIYEGDIVELADDQSKRSEIMFDLGRFGFKQYMWGAEFIPAAIDGNLVIIGNIHENPELLQGAIAKGMSAEG